MTWDSTDRGETVNTNISVRRQARLLRSAMRLVGMVLLSALFTTSVHAQGGDDLDSYKVRIEGYWVYSTPTGTLQGASDNFGIDLQRDLGFNSYSTFWGKLDWKFTHKNHLYFEGIPFQSTRSTLLNRNIVFQGNTFDSGLTIHSSLDAPTYIVGYQYDIIRRRRGHLGFGVQINIFDTHATISAAAQVTNTGTHAARSASGSLLAPIPVGGPDFRLYLTNSPRVFVEGNVFGMYFFGYGNYVSAYGTLGFGITKHLSMTAGYQLGSRLVVNSDTSANRVGLSMTEEGPLAGLQFSF